MKIATTVYRFVVALLPFRPHHQWSNFSSITGSVRLIVSVRQQSIISISHSPMTSQSKSYCDSASLVPDKNIDPSGEISLSNMDTHDGFS